MLVKTTQHLLPWAWQSFDNGIDVVEKYVALFHLEQAYYSPVHDYLTQLSNSVPKRGKINPSHRKILCKWALPIIDHFKFDHKVAFVFMHFLDKATACLLRKQGHDYVSHRDYQLIAVTSLYLAVKLHGQQVHHDINCTKARPVVVAIETFVSLGKEQGFTVEMVKTKECEILFYLDWHLHPTTPLCFLNLLVKFLPTSWSDVCIQPDLKVVAFVLSLAVFLTELTLSDRNCAFQFTSSEIACAAIQCAVEALDYLVGSTPCMLQFQLEPAASEVKDTLLESLGNGLSMPIEKVDMICSKLKDLFTESPDDCSLPEDLVALVSSHWNGRGFENDFDLLLEVPLPNPAAEPLPPIGEWTVDDWDLDIGCFGVDMETIGLALDSNVPETGDSNPSRDEESSAHGNANENASLFDSNLNASFDEGVTEDRGDNRESDNVQPAQEREEDSTDSVVARNRVVVPEGVHLLDGNLNASFDESVFEDRQDNREQDNLQPAQEREGDTENEDRNRVVVPEGVHVISDDECEVTPNPIKRKYSNIESVGRKRIRRRIDC